MTTYDDYLAQKVEDYLERCYCEPKITLVEKEYEGPGNIRNRTFSIAIVAITKNVSIITTTTKEKGNNYENERASY